MASKLAQSKYSKRVVLKSILGRRDHGLGLVGERVVVGGWVKASTELKKEVPPIVTDRTRGERVTCVEIFQTRVPLFRNIFKAFSPREKLEPPPALPSACTAYLQVNDGSCLSDLQVVLESSTAPISQFTPMGTSILVQGVLEKQSDSGKHDIELKVEKILHVGSVDHQRYPLAKEGIPLDDLRTFPHLRPQTKTIASIAQIRSALSQATHTFFQNHDFLYVHMPVITSVDSKGFSEKFQVRLALVEKEEQKEERLSSLDDTRGPNLQVVRNAIEEKTTTIQELNRSDSNKEALFLAIEDLKKTIQLASQLEEEGKSMPSKIEETDSSKDFFPQQMYLTASSQLHLESYACALGNVYTFGPTFQAEKSQPTKHLAESWMVETEMAFADLEDVMNCAEDYIKFLCQWVLENCPDVTKFISNRVDYWECLESVASSSFQKITYTEAVELLEKVTDEEFEEKIEWGLALTGKHESYLADKVYKTPVIIYNHPKEVKPFFARLNDDDKTVATIDVIAPKVGALVRGSQKEERFDKLSKRIDELGLPKEKYEWYLDLRRHGTVKHSGFSLGFDDMVLFATAQSDIRDVVAFPRSFGNASY